MKNNIRTKFMGILIIMLMILFSGVTYSFFLANTTIDIGSETVILTGTMRIQYSDTNTIYADNIVPGWTGSKTIEVSNTGDATVNYNLIWSSLINEFINDELVISITCSSNISDRECSGISNVPIASGGNNLLILNNEVLAGEVQTYQITVSFIETSSDQDYNKNKTFEGTFGIVEQGLNQRPRLTINTPSDIVESNSKKLIISVSPIGIGTSNDYQYYLSKSNTSLEGGSWINYENGKEFIIGEGLLGNYYLFVKRISNDLGEYTSINDITIDNVIYHRFGPYNINNPYLRIGNYLASSDKTVSGDTVNLYAATNGSPTQMCFSSSSTSSNCTWIPYSEEAYSYTLPSITGDHTVYVWFKDASGNISSNLSATTTLYAPTDASCFKYDSASTKITDYYCYEGNSDGLPTITDVVIPNTITSIGSQTFYNNKLTSVIIPYSVTKISWSAFESNNLTSVMIPDSVAEIGLQAFYKNKLTSVEYPGGIDIGGGVFNKNSLILDDPIMYYKNKDGSYDKSIIIGYINDGTGLVIIPDTVKIIKGTSFYNEGITNVTIPNGLTTIEQVAFQNNNLTSINIPNSVTTIEYHAFAYNQLTSVDYPGGIDIAGGVFNQNPLKLDDPIMYYKNNDGSYDKSIIIGCVLDETTSIIIPDTVNNIKSYAFRYAGLTSVTIPYSVTRIGTSAFSSNPNLTLIEIDNVSGAISGSPWGASKATITYLRTS